MFLYFCITDILNIKRGKRQKVASKVTCLTWACIAINFSHLNLTRERFHISIHSKMCLGFLDNLKVIVNGSMEENTSCNC